MKSTFPIQGIDCVSCATIVKNKSLKLTGVSSCFVDVEARTVQYEFDEKIINPEVIDKELHKYGYNLVLPSESGNNQKQQSDSSIEYRNLLISIPLVILALWDMIWMMGGDYGWRAAMEGVRKEFFHHILPIAATIMLFVVGPKYISAVRRYIKNGTASMDTLVGLGTIVAFIYSFIVSAFADILKPYIDTEIVYYEAVIVVIGFIALGKYMEHRTMKKSGEAIKALLNLQAKKAVLINVDGSESEIDVEQLNQGDLIHIKSGEKVALDCKIEKGSADIDEAMITGESIPVSKSIGDQLIGGTINLNGSIIGRISTSSKESYLSKIIQVVTAAQQSRPSIQALVDRIMNWFVPVVLGIAVLSALFWLFFGYDLVGSKYIALAVASFIGVLVIACPCGIGLATPMAVTTGVGHLAKHGILSKNAEGLLKLRKATTFIFDKTGTLTQGKPKVVTEKFYQPKEHTAKLLHTIESLANHPLAGAISDHYTSYADNKIEVTGFQTIVGSGVSGIINNKQYYITSPQFLTDKGYTIDSDYLSSITSQAMTPIVFADESEILAIIGIADTLKQEAIETIKELQKQGKEAIIISGDHADVVAHIAKQLNITQYYSAVKPEEKAELVKKISNKQGSSTKECNDGCCDSSPKSTKSRDFVVMVGDGINDAPALAQSDIGIAMSTGTDIAIESADMTLLHGDISKIIKAIVISKLTHSGIIQNLFRAFSYNIIGIPLAAGVLYLPFGLLLNPAFEGAAMAMSDLTVIGNSLRLQAKKI